MNFFYKRVLFFNGKVNSSPLPGDRVQQATSIEECAITTGIPGVNSLDEFPCIVSFSIVVYITTA